MPTDLILWIAFFAFWLFALYRATHRAFKIEQTRMQGLAFRHGPISSATIVFHTGLTSVLLVLLLTSVFEDTQILWFGLPGLLAPIIQGSTIALDRKTPHQDARTRRISPYWVAEQWPFALLGLSIGVAGAIWSILAATSYPLLLVGFSVFFFSTFWFYFENGNEISVSPTAFQYVRGFPKLRTFTHRRPRTKDLKMKMRRRRRGIYDIKIDEIDQTTIELTAGLSARHRLHLELEEYFVRTDQERW